MNEVTNEKLPYIVAIAKGRQARNQQHYVRENVVGFASLTDFCDRGSMYRFTMEMELFVHPGYTRKGIARCLLDRLLSTVSTSYQLKEGYQYEQRGDYLKNGAGRVVKTVNLAWPHGAQDNTDWVTKFLNEFDFKKAGHLRHMGAKLGKE
jgi:GNAT superfamily N-acetyltransferase